jgi:hypothetical protein
MKKLFTVLMLLFVFADAYAQEQNAFLLDKVLTQLKLNKKQIHEPFYRSKVLPNKTSNSVLVIPKYKTNETDKYGNYFLELDAYIVVADNATGKILNKYVEENAWTSDAFVLEDITIDTGIYKLNTENRAFGIRVDFRGSSRPNPFGQTDLSLFIIKNNQLKKVLNNFPISEYHGEWDTNCAGEFEDVTGSIDLDKNKSNGFKNLIIKSKIKDTKSVWLNDDCKQNITIKNSTQYLKFNGKEYK